MSGHQDGGPAFPREDYQTDNAPGQRGMTLRDYFAIHEPIDPNESIGKRMAEQLLGRPMPETLDMLECAMFWADAEAAYRYMRADAMLRARAVSAKVKGE